MLALIIIALMDSNNKVEEVVRIIKEERKILFLVDYLVPKNLAITIRLFQVKRILIEKVMGIQI